MYYSICWVPDVRGSVHQNTNHKEKSNKMQQCIKIFIIPYLYEAQHVSDDTPPIIRSLKLQLAASGFLYVEGCWTCSWWTLSGTYCTWQRPPTTRPTTFHVWKIRGCQCSFRLLMMGGVSPETCWASYKYGVIKFWYIVASCWIFLYECWVLLHGWHLIRLQISLISKLTWGILSTLFVLHVSLRLDDGCRNM